MTAHSTSAMFVVESGPNVARCSMSVVDGRAIVYSVVRCHKCQRRIMDIPGQPKIITRLVDENRASGLGRVVPCKRCGSWTEVIER